MRLNKVKLEDAKAFITELTILKEQAFRVGMFATGQKLEIPVKEAGYELASLMDEGNIE